jgi:hypothetical protein
VELSDGACRVQVAAVQAALGLVLGELVRAGILGAAGWCDWVSVSAYDENGFCKLRRPDVQWLRGRGADRDDDDSWAASFATMHAHVLVMCGQDFGLQISFSDLA